MRVGSPPPAGVRGSWSGSPTGRTFLSLDDITKERLRWGSYVSCTGFRAGLSSKQAVDQTFFRWQKGETNEEIEKNDRV